MIRISGEATIGKGRGKHVRIGPFVRPGMVEGTSSIFQTITHNLNTKIVSVMLSFVGPGETYPGYIVQDFWWTSGNYTSRAFNYKWKVIDQNIIELELFRFSNVDKNYIVDIYGREDFF
jgi:hypothetical protein